MSEASEPNKKCVFVVGSKPDAVFPEVIPDRIYAVNGAIARVEQYSGEAEIIGVISRSVIFSNDELDVKTRALWRGQKVDRVIVNINTGWSRKVPDDAKFLESKLQELGLIFSSFSWVGNRYRMKILQSRKKSRLLYEVVRRLKSAETGKFIWELKRTKILPELGISGGVRALVIANDETPPEAKIYLIGIGARKSNGHYYDQSAPFIGHAARDKNFLLDFASKNPQRVVATDPVLSRYLGIYG